MILENIINTEVTLVPACLLFLSVSRFALAVVGFNIKKNLNKCFNFCLPQKT